MSDLPPIPDPLECVLFDAGDTLLAPSPSFHGRFVQVAARHGFELEEAAAVAAIAATVRAVEWPTDWTDPATQRSFWLRFYRRVLVELGHREDGDVLALEGVERRFAAVAISGKLGVAKPEPGIFLAALEQAGVAAETTVHVGDQLVNDVEAALAVGITPVLLDRFARVPAADGHRVQSMTELVALLDGGV